MKTNKRTTVNNILVECNSSSDCLKTLYNYYKSELSNAFSLGYICGKSSIPSKGYLSEVFNGKKILNPKYWEGVSKTFSLTQNQDQVLQILFKIDFSTDINEKNDLSQELLIKRKKLKTRYDENLYLVEENIFFIFEIFSRINTGSYTLEALQEYYQDKNKNVLESVKVLMKNEMIKIEEDCFVAAVEDLQFSTGISAQMSKTFIEQSLGVIKSELKGWLVNEKDSVLQTSIISVNKDKYAKEVSKIKETLDDIQLTIESPEADALVLFNVQIGEI